MGIINFTFAITEIDFVQAENINFIIKFIIIIYFEKIPFIIN